MIPGKVQRTAGPKEDFPQQGSCRQLFEDSPLYTLFHQESTQENTQEDGPCLQRGAALKTFAVALLTDRRNWEKIGIALLAALLFLLPVLSVLAVFQGDFDWDSPELVSAVIQELDVGSLGFLEGTNSVLAQLQEALRQRVWDSTSFARPRRYTGWRCRHFQKNLTLWRSWWAASPRTRPTRN